MANLGLEIEYETTDKHFEYFKKRVKYWLREFGLIGWRVFFEHGEADIGNNERGYAKVDFDIDGRNATFTLGLNWESLKPTKALIDHSAFHEVCELLLGRLRVMAYSRFVNSDEIKEEVHAIIRTLENVILEN